VSRGAPAEHRKRWSRPGPVVALALLLTAFGCITLGLRGHQVPLSDPVAQQDTPLVNPAPAPAVPGMPAPAPSNAAGSATPRSAPVALQIPAIGVAVSLSTLGVNPNQTVQVPTNFQQPGWFGLGPSPGQTGSAVILGHVDSYKGPAVFFRIRALRAGDQVDVSLADGVTTHFVVNTVATYTKDQFPAQQVYASHGASALQLVTCGGTFDTHTRSYLSNVVAYTTLVGTTPATQP
jgi:sortase (surface protein transpeptidase)